MTNLKSLALKAHESESEDRHLEHVKKQKEFVKSVVGEENYGECSYDFKSDTWDICGKEFRCFTNRDDYNAPSKVPALGVWNGSNRHDFAYTLADIGYFLKKDAEKEAYAKAHRPPLWYRIRGYK